MSAGRTKSGHIRKGYRLTSGGRVVKASKKGKRKGKKR